MCVHDFSSDRDCLQSDMEDWGRTDYIIVGAMRPCARNLREVVCSIIVKIHFPSGENAGGKNKEPANNLKMLHDQFGSKLLLGKF